MTLHFTFLIKLELKKELFGVFLHKTCGSMPDLRCYVLGKEIILFFCLPIPLPYISVHRPTLHR